MMSRVVVVLVLLGGASAEAPAPECGSSEYCCPDAKKCLEPSNVSCAADEKACDGSDHPVCCPLTKICVKPSKNCTTACPDAGSYCSPAIQSGPAKVATCVSPTNPGHFCKEDSDCGKSLRCCGLTKLCVAVGGICKIGEDLSLVV